VAEAIFEPRATGTLDDYVAHLAWLPNGKSLAIAGGEGKVLVADFADDKLAIREVGEHMLGTLALAAHAKAPVFATSGQDGVALWDAATGASVKRWRPGPLATEQLAFSPDGKSLASAAGKVVSLWSTTGEAVHAFAPAAGTASAIAFDKSGRDLGVALNGEMAVHRIDKGNYRTRRYQWDGACLTVSFSPNGKVLASGMADGSVHFWYLSSAKDSQMRGYGSRVALTGFSSNSRLLATSAGNEIVVWDFSGKGPEGSRPQQLLGHTERVECFDWQPNGGLLVSGGRDWRVSLWNPSKHEQAIDAHLADSEVTAIRWSPDSRYVAVGEKKGRLTIYELVNL
jgi:WD40 repeat protein